MFFLQFNICIRHPFFEHQNMSSQELPWDYTHQTLSSSQKKFSNSAQSTKIILLLETVIWFLALIFLYLMQTCVDWVLIIFGTQVITKKRLVRPVFPDELSVSYDYDLPYKSALTISEICICFNELNCRYFAFQKYAQLKRYQQSKT